jgi:MFS family permease
VGFYFFGGAGMVLALILYRFLREPQRGQADREVRVDAHVEASLRDAISPDAHLGLGETEPRGADSVPPLTVPETIRSVFRTPTAILLMTVFLGANFVATIFLTWTPTYLVEKFDFKLTAAGLSGSVFIHLASAFGAPMGGLLADRLARRLSGGRMLVQATGLLVGSVFVFLVGATSDVTVLLAAMTLFGLCKGLYDSNIFASLYDVVEPRARATAAGIMNTVGWGGGALGPLWVALMAQYGPRATEIENMSLAIAWGGAIYLVGAALLAVAVFAFARRDVIRAQ